MANFPVDSRVQLVGLSVQTLNGATARVIGPLADDGRLPVMILAPAAARAAFPASVRVKLANVVSAGAEAPAPRLEPRAAGVPEPWAWSNGLSPAQRRAWLVDCYRMRVDDEYAWAGGNLTGLYDPEATAESIVKDFLVFAKLAAARRVVPPGWSWPECLAEAGKLLPYAFEKSDAKEKWGGENVFSAMLGGRSLRFTGETVYVNSVTNGGGASFNAAPGAEAAANARPEALFDRPTLLDDVGGAAAWRSLRDALARNPVLAARLAGR